MPDGINETNVNAWLQEFVPSIEPPLNYAMITGGHSNLTFRCEDADSTFVLRRPPLGAVLESAHDMGREHKIISALANSPVPVPKTYGLCRDVAVNEAPFYVMEYIDGTVLNDSFMGAEVPLEQRADIGLNVIDILSKLHLVDLEAVGLADLGRKEAYLSRQMKRWGKQWQATKTHEVPAMEESARLLQERMPAQVGATIVHGDYRLGNIMVRDGQVKAILDWELCTLGDPLADVGYLLNNWSAPGEIDEPAEDDHAPTSAGGYGSRDELCEIYTQNTGRDLSNIDYYRAFSHWRLAAIGQGVYKRYLVGAMGADSEMDLQRQKDNVSIRAEDALELLS
ncbi:MAG: phosphotransferase family protein [Pseudomonadales bacterium]|nr:phosphotransferase family protein [Pseudomonadales bacterium]